jgi:hypothetical protein
MATLENTKNQNQDSYIWDNPNYPNKTSQDEDIILLIREDIIILIFKAVGLYFIFFGLLFFRLIAISFSDRLWLYFFDFALYSIATMLTVQFLVMFHNYYLSLQIITNKRIIDIDQTGLFRREINSTSLDNIQDVTKKKTSIPQLFFNFGDVIVETAGRTGSEAKNAPNGFVFNNVPNPAEISHLIQVVREKNVNQRAIDQARIEASYLEQILHRKSLT